LAPHIPLWANERELMMDLQLYKTLSGENFWGLWKVVIMRDARGMEFGVGLPAIHHWDWALFFRLQSSRLNDTPPTQTDPVGDSVIGRGSSVHGRRARVELQVGTRKI